MPGYKEQILSEQPASVILVLRELAC